MPDHCRVGDYIVLIGELQGSRWHPGPSVGDHTGLESHPMLRIGELPGSRWHPGLSVGDHTRLEELQGPLWLFALSTCTDAGSQVFK